MHGDAQFADDQERMHQIELQLDSCYGECHLRMPVVATMVQTTLLHFDEQRYKLRAWVIMPNHVHVVMEVFDGHPLSEVVHSWKSYTAHSANKMLYREGAFWATEYFDRFIRDADHYAHVVHYIHQNPVKSGLAPCAEAWPFSSAYQPGAQASSPA
jgi:REP element-mobilizing transposase RayT